MTMKIQVLQKVRKTVEEQVLNEVELEFPTEHRFYKRNDDGNFFPRGLVLFGIKVKYSKTFLLFEIERGRQFYTDFVPTKDCRQDYWLEDDNTIRRTALKIMLGQYSAFEEITEQEFLELRQQLLDAPLCN